MNPESDREAALFQAALQLEGIARGAFLTQACHGDVAFRARLDSLLAAHEASEGPLATQAHPVRPTIDLHFSENPAADSPDEAIGQCVGRYKLLERIGEGGCGVVYVAEQSEPVRRRVALKVIKLGMDTRQVVARFEAERQALAMMDHPNIAKVLDAGTTGLGRPFFVMELVRGVPITEYCDQAHSSTGERLDLFIRVCHAIQHAHQKGIIHRDIKPSNILVTLHDGVPVPKVIDFGIAKATEGRLTDATIYTALHQFIGTPAYMSPEQAEMSGLDIDTRSDIYSLGVLLYELLAGITPFDPKELISQGIDAMRRTIREKEPQRPSTRLATLGPEQQTTTAKRRSADTARLLYQLQGDLDWIVMKCLEKDRQRRYESAIGLAADLKRHLNNEPVVARPPSTAYRFQKAYRRNRLAFLAGGVLLVGLLTALSALAFALVRERSLKSESARADAIALFATGLLDEAVPRLVREENLTGARALLESADRLVSVVLTNSPAAELAVRDTLMMYGYLSDPASHLKQVGRLDSLLTFVSDDRLPVNRSRDNLRADIAGSRMAGGAIDQGKVQLEALIQELRQRGPSADVARANAAGSLGELLLSLNRSLEAEPYLEEAQRLDGIWGRGYAEALIQNGNYQKASEAALRTIDWLDREGPQRPEWASVLNRFRNLGELYGYTTLVQAQCLLGKFQDIESLLKQRLASSRNPPWSPMQIRRLHSFQIGIQAYSGRWQEAASRLIDSARSPSADLGDLVLGMATASALAKSELYGELNRRVRARYVAIATPETAGMQFEALILHPQPDDLTSVLPDLLARIEEGAGFNLVEPTLPFLRAQLAYRRGAYEDALRNLDAWLTSAAERPFAAFALRYTQSISIPQFWRAMILARLGRREEALRAYEEGIQREKAGLKGPEFLLTACFSKAFQREAREVLEAEGIAVPTQLLRP